MFFTYFGKYLSNKYRKYIYLQMRVNERMAGYYQWTQILPELIDIFSHLQTILCWQSNKNVQASI